MINSKWAEAVKHPTGLIAFALSLMFSAVFFLLPDEPSWRYVFLILAIVTVLGGLLIASKQIEKGKPEQKSGLEIWQEGAGSLAAGKQIQHNQGGANIGFIQAREGATINIGQPASQINPKVVEQLTELVFQQNLELREKDKALKEKKYLDVQKQLDEKKPTDPVSAQVKTLLDQGRFDEAGTALDKEIETQEKDAGLLAHHHFIRAEIFSLQFRPLQALPHYERAHRLKPGDPVYTHQYAATLQEQNRFPEAQAVYEQNLATLRRLAGQNPGAYEPDVAMTLNNLGALYYATQKHEQAAAAYNEALDIRRKLAEKNPEAYEPYVAMTLNNLGLLYADTQKHAEAENAYKKALDSYRKLAEKNPGAYEPDVAMTLNNLAVLYVFNLNQPDEAWKLVEDGLEILRRLWIRYPPAFGDDLARSLMMLIEAGIKLEKNHADLCARAREMERAAYREDLKDNARNYIQRFCGK
ncbi:MAG: tetratricopeptide repeat protein [Nitrospinae bacterium]|nr:tetratricopeptide repeat protein [Nitrospinota bacterium]